MSFHGLCAYMRCASRDSWFVASSNGSAGSRRRTRPLHSPISGAVGSCAPMAFAAAHPGAQNFTAVAGTDFIVG